MSQSYQKSIGYSNRGEPSYLRAPSWGNQGDDPKIERVVGATTKSTVMMSQV
jgi:hypothetical protein